MNKILPLVKSVVQSLAILPGCCEWSPDELVWLVRFRFVKRHLQQPGCKMLRAGAKVELTPSPVFLIDLGADPQPLRDVLAITVKDGALTERELDGILGAVQMLAGQRVNLMDFVPQSWLPFVMDFDQAKAGGYFG